ncbi:hypothetical protein RirG_001090 [Rhizophagus irregularis DAOM 197198w]|uniref:Uncharacterized protein n=1 Tax=Rhizophagus irregularis (strain DAOM 197198w) TaxID=1432141 RepID=A0A015KJW4_RHIIW|nr:hypothetical protein RirG_001090 [Rhizophagus irregularis DAOM 197198w]
MGGNSKLLIALERGIGVHHSGLPKKYLSAVEILFRRRHLRVIIATGSLALDKCPEDREEEDLTL